MAEAMREAMPFNSALETGVRTLAILVEAYPSKYDIQRLLYFDYLVVHSRDANGPESLHPNIPLRNGELLVRRGVIERGLLLFISRGLVERQISTNGINYGASDEAGPFLDCLQTHYSQMLRQRAEWAISEFGMLDNDELRIYFDEHFERWTREFQAVKMPSEHLL
ncbi:ABC-three component system middle component 2 [Nitrospirillum amazonense]|uniref:ABC-three component system middle component 2 n=1 Tax=Nitrospirillum amazonense TaxID=28077 RepID=UPI002DD42B1F|nr:ABC-three component system middle component 2 [Nitrospirillum amazonense]MEC4589681.1 ABC-three component system middle component 2 [Nitrospirillum amazonense]